jgi:sterol desaturase/sphingolipid hydroxylase (fatty acid hydroxylase superfamily)
MRIRHVLGPWFFVFILGSIALEIGWYLLVQKRSYPWREVATSVGVYVLRMPARLLAPLVVAPLAYYLWARSPFTVPLDTAWGLVLLFLAEECAYYWMHRTSHEVRWLWASHVVHHTPEHIHLASAFRLGATEILSGNWLFHLPLYFLGFNPIAVGAMSSLNLFYQFWLHTDVVGRLGPLEWVLNTPSHHRVHHASNPEYLDRNYGGIVIIWDRLFATFAAERADAPIVYGLTHPIGSGNPVTILFHEWIVMAQDAWRAGSWRERLRQLFGRPGDSLSSRGT